MTPHSDESRESGVLNNKPTCMSVDLLPCWPQNEKLGLMFSCSMQLGLGVVTIQRFPCTIMIIWITFPSKALLEGVPPIAIWPDFVDA